MREKISVIVPVYKVEPYLNRCIESIVNQTYHDLEIILIDDGSPDRCPQICDEWAEKDERIVVIHQDNSGIAKTRNTGIRSATGNYIMQVDSDDYLAPTAAEFLYNRIVADGTKMAIGKHVDVYGNGTSDNTFCSWMKDSIITKDEMFYTMGREKRFAVTSWAKLFHRTVFQNLTYPQLTCGEDCWLFPLIVDQCDTISVVDVVVYYYFQRDTSILHTTTDQKLLDDIFANLFFSHFLFERGFQEAAQKWYKSSLDKVFRMRNKKMAIHLYSDCYNASETKKLMRHANIELRLKRFCMYVPILYPMMQTAKKLQRRIS